jgi:hypothetical protein
MAIAPAPPPVSQAPPEEMTETKRARTTSAWTLEIIKGALTGAFTKLNPRVQARNPVMFVVEVGAAITTVVFLKGLIVGGVVRQGSACDADGHRPPAEGALGGDAARQHRQPHPPSLSDRRHSRRRRRCPKGEVMLLPLPCGLTVRDSRRWRPTPNRALRTPNSLPSAPPQRPLSH